VGTEWVQNLDPWSAWAPPRMTISDPLKSTSLFRTLTASRSQTLITRLYCPYHCHTERTSCLKVTVELLPSFSSPAGGPSLATSLCSLKTGTSQSCLRRSQRMSRWYICMTECTYEASLPCIKVNTSASTLHGANACLRRDSIWSGHDLR